MRGDKKASLSSDLVLDLYSSLLRGDLGHRVGVDRGGHPGTSFHRGHSKSGRQVSLSEIHEGFGGRNFHAPSQRGLPQGSSRRGAPGVSGLHYPSLRSLLCVSRRCGQQGTLPEGLPKSEGSRANHIPEIGDTGEPHIQEPERAPLHDHCHQHEL